MVSSDVRKQSAAGVGPDVARASQSAIELAVPRETPLPVLVPIPRNRSFNCPEVSVLDITQIFKHVL